MSSAKIINTIYHSAVIGSLSIGYSVLAKNMFRMRPADLGRSDIEDIVKVIVVITAGIATKDFLVAQGIILENISA